LFHQIGILCPNSSEPDARQESDLEQEFCKMEIRHILFKEIRFLISLNNQAKQLSIKELLFEKEK
jgi:hypothetical protein